MLRNPVGLSYAVVALLAAMVAADAGLFAAALDVRLLMAGDLNDHPDPAGFAHLGVDVVAVLQVLIQLALSVVFIIWFFRVRKNAGVFAPDLHRGGPGWAIGAWFVPIANLWWPRSVAAGVWRASRRDPYGDGKGEGESLAVLNWWWVFWVLTDNGSLFATAVYDDADTVEEFVVGSGFLMGAAVLDIVAALLAILFVRRLTSMQHAKATGMIPAA
ncbi:DUF4328 domain-containing protein [Streptomyces lateritius]|uniref:DUF4328 domain-containing protein n=1 Tax=Streptomyces lateritius TaxID=67313 RepID=UPI00167AB772|nr:DUF4328 domain-containing protein [Streptomyces lateritius]GGT89855.1 hypothetical protein GCM10010272_38400 [Streptomyces lateritius]